MIQSKKLMGGNMLHNLYIEGSSDLALQVEMRGDNFANVMTPDGRGRLVEKADLRKIFGAANEAADDLRQKVEEVLADTEAILREAGADMARALAGVQMDLRAALGKPLPEEPGAGVIAQWTGKGGIAEQEFRRLSDGGWVSNEYSYIDGDCLLDEWKVVRVL